MPIFLLAIKSDPMRRTIDLAKSTIERLLEDQHGDLHEVIPALVEQHGQHKAAYLLGVHQSWISTWLRKNGYIQEVRWIKPDLVAQ
jgi:hypothetical protein